MGRTRAEGMAGEVAAGRASLREALVWHLFSNHYPPVNPRFVPTAAAAIEAVRDGDTAVEITMPNGLTRTAGEIITGLHLEEFL